MLRHTYATTVLDADANPHDIQIAARHADPKPAIHCDIATGARQARLVRFAASRAVSADDDRPGRSGATVRCRRQLARTPVP
jgi:hypothetical protein